MRALTEDERLHVEELLSEDLTHGGDFEEIARAVGVDPTHPLSDAETALVWEEQRRRKEQSFIDHVLQCRS